MNQIEKESKWYKAFRHKRKCSLENWELHARGWGVVKSNILHYSILGVHPTPINKQANTNGSNWKTIKVNQRNKRGCSLENWELHARGWGVVEWNVRH